MHYMWITCGAQGVGWGIRVVYDVRLYYLPKVYGGRVLYIGGTACCCTTQASACKPVDISVIHTYVLITIG